MITGEGSLDEQSLAGKAPVGVARGGAAGRRSRSSRCAGGCLLSGEQLQTAGISAAYALSDLEPDVRRSMADAGPLLERLARTLARERIGGSDSMTSVPLFVNGGGMRGGNVHYSIEGLPFLGEARTAPRYRFFSIRDEFPGLWPVAEGGVSVPGELYDVPLDVIRDRFIPAEPAELELSVIELDDGSSAVAVVLREVAHEAGTG